MSFAAMAGVMLCSIPFKEQSSQRECLKGCGAKCSFSMHFSGIVAIIKHRFENIEIVRTNIRV